MIFHGMIERVYTSLRGEIHYWTNVERTTPVTLVFVPGLTFDHSLFDRQIEFFKDRYRILVCDAPTLAAYWTSDLSFTMRDFAMWLDNILLWEEINAPVIIGHSLGGCVGQMYAQLFPDKLKGFIAIDSVPLQRGYLSDVDIWMLKRRENLFRIFPWKALLKRCAKYVASSEYGRSVMRDILMKYEGERSRYARLAGHSIRIMAEAMDEDLPYEIQCPALLICGEKDRVGYCRRINKAWNKKTGIPIEWVRGAGHNSNTDNPGAVNTIISEFLKTLCTCERPRHITMASENCPALVESGGGRRKDPILQFVPPEQ